jgi:hypothetical protein
MEYLLQQNNNSNSYIFAVEEPEAFMHTEWQRNLVESIQLSDLDNVQTFFTSQSAEFIKYVARNNLWLGDQNNKRTSYRSAEIFSWDEWKEYSSKLGVSPEVVYRSDWNVLVLVEGVADQRILDDYYGKICATLQAEGQNCRNAVFVPVGGLGNMKAVITLELAKTYGTDRVIMAIKDHPSLANEDVDEQVNTDLMAQGVNEVFTLNKSDIFCYLEPNHAATASGVAATDLAIDDKRQLLRQIGYREDGTIEAVSQSFDNLIQPILDQTTSTEIDALQDAELGTILRSIATANE